VPTLPRSLTRGLWQRRRYWSVMVTFPETSTYIEFLRKDRLEKAATWRANVREAVALCNCYRIIVTHG
jgi:hypothetical protein